MRRSRRLVMITALVLAAVAACAEPGIDHGDYPVTPPSAAYDETPGLWRGTLTESLRIGERVLRADTIDPELTDGRGGGVLLNPLGRVSAMLSGPQQTALRDFDVLAGFGAIGGNDKRADERADKYISVAALSFASEAVAGDAARAMAAADFGSNTDNRPFELPEYPAALNHWRPGVPTVGSWLVWRNLVFRVVVKVTEPREDLLADLLNRVYRAQLTAMDGFTPTPAADLPALRHDPEHLLTRFVTVGEKTFDPMRFAVYRPHAYALLTPHPATTERGFTDLGVSRVAVSDNKFGYRVRDAAAAAALLDDPGTLLLGSIATDPMPGVGGLPAVRCRRAQRPSVSALEARRFSCRMAVDDLVVEVFSNDETDVRRLAAAQYAVMTAAR
ncbi:DUF7373 family lipoprotein [Nocardia thailandica]|uniref:Lipoprotein n=1 Tax=Nocardia thailandica TaxID=257275 RepID=A0ABW6PGS8_9NOCA